MKIYNLYANADGISIGLTNGYDICEPTDDDCAVVVVGHRAYASSVEQAHAAIRDAYIERMESAGTLNATYKEYRDHVRSC